MLVPEKIIFIGPLNLGKLPLDGETAKNQILHDYIKFKYSNIKFVDTLHWKRSPIVMFKLFIYLIIIRNRKIVLSICPDSANLVSKILFYSGRKKNLLYFVIGGSFAEKINAKEYNSKYYQHYSKIYVEGISMVKKLNLNGLINVEHLPNFKKFNTKLLENKPNAKNLNDKFHFVFLSRITEEKGVKLIIDAIKNLNDQQYHDQYDCTFYGNISDTFKSIFEREIRVIPNAKYGGIIDLSSDIGFKALANHDIMLFPTIWHGEGFPGVLIDAFIAGLPIIASDWNLNSEIIENNKTGFLIPPKNLISLIEIMKFSINNQPTIYNMKINCLNNANNFHIDKVMKNIQI
jgi:glycosyltransferase involved in cell wall biosynthesis